LSTPSVHAAHTLSLSCRNLTLCNVCPLLTSADAQARETDSTVMGNSQQSSSVTSRDWATAVAAASSPAPVRAMSSNMFSALSHLDDCGDEGSDSLNDAPFVEHYSRRSAFVDVNSPRSSCCSKDRTRTLASPAMGHWGTYPLDLQQFNFFSVHFDLYKVL